MLGLWVGLWVGHEEGLRVGLRVGRDEGRLVGRVVFFFASFRDIFRLFSLDPLLTSIPFSFINDEFSLLEAMHLWILERNSGAKKKAS